MPNSEDSNRLKRIALQVAALFIAFFVVSSIGLKNYFLIVIVTFIVGAITLITVRYVFHAKESIVIKNVSKRYALTSAASVIRMLDDQYVGYPSGTFVAEIEGDALLAREFEPPGAAFDIFKRIVFFPWRVTSSLAQSVLFSGRGSEESTAFYIYLAIQAFRSIITFVVAMYLFFPMVFALLSELILKPLVASQIHVTASQNGPDANLEVSFKGISARMVQSRFKHSFEAPKLPERYAVREMNAE